MTQINIDRAIRARWDEKNLTAEFRAFWLSTHPNFNTRHPWNEAPVRPKTPMPYVAYSSLTARFAGGRSTGKSSEPDVEIEYLAVPIRFVVVAQTRDITGGKQSGKEVAAFLVKKLIAAYEDAAGPLTLDDFDCHTETVVMPDLCGERTDDDVWEWLVPFEVHITRRRKLRGVA